MEMFNINRIGNPDRWHVIYLRVGLQGGGNHPQEGGQRDEGTDGEEYVGKDIVDGRIGQFEGRAFLSSNVGRAGFFVIHRTPLILESCY